jgi:hypothetical protein
MIPPPDPGMRGEELDYPGCSSRIRIFTFYPSWISDPGVKKTPDPGSGSAKPTYTFNHPHFFPFTPAPAYFLNHFTQVSKLPRLLPDPGMSGEELDDLLAASIPV